MVDFAKLIGHQTGWGKGRLKAENGNPGHWVAVSVCSRCDCGELRTFRGDRGSVTGAPERLSRSRSLTYLSGMRRCARVPFESRALAWTPSNGHLYLRHSTLRRGSNAGHNDGTPAWIAYPGRAPETSLAWLRPWRCRKWQFSEHPSCF